MQAAASLPASSPLAASQQPVSEPASRRARACRTSGFHLFSLSLQHCRTGPWPDVVFLDPVVWHLFKIKNLTAYNMELLELLQTLKTQVLLLPFYCNAAAC